MTTMTTDDLLVLIPAALLLAVLAWSLWLRYRKPTDFKALDAQPFVSKFAEPPVGGPDHPMCRCVITPKVVPFAMTDAEIGAAMPSHAPIPFDWLHPFRSRKAEQRRRARLAEFNEHMRASTAIEQPVVDDLLDALVARSAQ